MVGCGLGGSDSDEELGHGVSNESKKVLNKLSEIFATFSR